VWQLFFLCMCVCVLLVSFFIHDNTIALLFASCPALLCLSQPVSMCTSVVSSKMLAEIGKREGFHVEESLTGFKWIGSRSAALQAEGYRHLFGYEEAIGFAW
jgi:phosphomannomutase